MTGQSETIAADTLVVGAGMVGLALAVALADAGFRVSVVDREAPGAMTGTGFDGRTSAIAHGSGRLLQAIGVWEHLAGEAEPILDIRVSDGASPLFLHYDRREVGTDAFGHIVENRVLRRALLARAAALPDLTLMAPAELVGIWRGPRRVAARLGDGTRIVAPVIAAAEGRNSALRHAAGITVSEWRYDQTAIVCTLAHVRPHGGVAHERFLPAGPFAILPMTDGPEGQHRSSIVWTERVDLAPALLALDDAAFMAELGHRFGDFLGDLALVGPRWSYPVGVLHAERYIDQRLALVGDAAHVIHPIAGQGLNMGLRDVAALAEVLVDARRLGLDPGDALTLERYQRWRRFDNVTLVVVTDLLNRLFSNDVEPIRLARDIGLAAVQHLPPLKRFFMRHAMGMVGDLPRLVRGERL
ncbi:MAG: FAD-dependent oxidoreductase [Alphaproteobacteria bacterium]|nr:FAD-dependent oxidoreductase [Alphaproteobacteria bacterium]